jgi:hypothetical protein
MSVLPGRAVMVAALAFLLASFVVGSLLPRWQAQRQPVAAYTSSMQQR